MTDTQIKHMVERFLQWKLPENFNPDGGISFKKTFNEHTSHPMKHEPVGTNLFDYSQAEMMVRHMIEGLPDISTTESHDEDCPCWGDTVEHSADCKNCTCDKDEFHGEASPSQPAPPKGQTCLVCGSTTCCCEKFTKARASGGASQPAPSLLEKLLIETVTLAIMRHNLRPEGEEEDLSLELAREIAQDAAWAMQGEGTCDETPAAEWTACVAGGESQWVPVEVRLPKSSGTYIVAIDAFGDDGDRCIDALPAEWDLNHKRWCNLLGWGSNEVTHWIPLPAPPSAPTKQEEK